MRHPSVHACAALSLLTLAGCAHIVSPELRSEATPGLTFPMVLANPSAYTGSIVIWGGLVIGIRNRADGTILTVLETPLENGERPEGGESSRGRFLATTSRYLDPAIYHRGTRVTIAGEITGKEMRAVGEKPYLYPVVAIQEIHLWKRRVTVYGGPYDWGPYPYGWWGPSPWGDSYWYAAPDRFGEGPEIREGGTEHREEEREEGRGR